jgi:hypothetical protein
VLHIEFYLAVKNFIDRNRLIGINEKRWVAFWLYAREMKQKRAVAGSGT